MSKNFKISISDNKRLEIIGSELNCFWKNESEALWNVPVKDLRSIKLIQNKENSKLERKEAKFISKILFFFEIIFKSLIGIAVRILIGPPEYENTIDDRNINSIEIRYKIRDSIRWKKKNLSSNLTEEKIGNLLKVLRVTNPKIISNLDQFYR